MKKLVIVEGIKDRGVFVVVDSVGKIECIDFDEKVDWDYSNYMFIEEIDVFGMCVLFGKLSLFRLISFGYNNECR